VATGRLCHDVGWQPKDIATKNPIESSIKLPQACEGKHYFTLACLYNQPFKPMPF